MIGKGHEELEESYTGAIHLDSKPTAPIVLSTEGLSSGRAFPAMCRSTCGAGEVLGIYGFMGCGQIELTRALVRQIESLMPGTSGDRVRDPGSAQHGAGAPRRHRLRAGKPAVHAVLSRAGL